MPTARLTRIVSFSAAHRYYRPSWSSARNVEVFGACANEHGHGHNYRCWVTVAGEVGEETGMIMDLKDLDQVLREEVVEPMDHRHLNHHIPEFAYGATVPTAEAIAVYVWRRISPRLPEGITLWRVRIEEDSSLYAEYFGAE